MSDDELERLNRETIAIRAKLDQSEAKRRDLEAEASNLLAKLIESVLETETRRPGILTEAHKHILTLPKDSMVAGTVVSLALIGYSTVRANREKS